ncbi:LysE family translocator [Aestuariispira insulae]|uniref:Threonine/homoserine/homoserine lactone efflux protein n=1 Tax=Aestuariispira insulae TaxID=1461337 RepID=A0A3D9HMK5_9PROT|nr:LysE family translocator [Aestuariispira insulae]RED50732.1 threonine/homoserine/homoserine lactone efflux protein [Aestuariispira insulae]
MSAEFWIAYCATIFIASIIPGPSMLLALTHGMRFGLRHSLMTAAGNTVASGIQASLALTGLGAVLFASEWVFQIIKWCGAAYLLYIGYMMWRHPMPAPEVEAKLGKSQSGWKLFYQAFVVAMGNPKAIVFFTALFPQFIQGENGSFLLYMEMTLVLSVIAFLCMMIYATGGKNLSRLIRRSGVRKWLSKGIGGLFMGGGVGLALSSR